LIQERKKLQPRLIQRSKKQLTRQPFFSGKKFFQWKKEQADHDQAHQEKEIEVRKMEAENRKLELELQIAVMKQKQNNNEGDK
jgi:hypothetical protein